MVRNVKALTASSYLSMFFLGFMSTLVGAAARNIGLTPFQIGLMLAFQNVGFVISVSISGALADVREKPRLLFWGTLAVVAGLMVFYGTDIFALYLLAMLLLGLGIGTYEGVTDAMLIDLHAGRESLHISVNHFFVTFGSIAITTYMLFLQMNWRNAIIQAAAVVAALALFFALAKLEVRSVHKHSYRERVAVLGREPIILILFACIMLAVGVETGCIGILTTFLMELRGFDQVTSKIGLLTFLFGIVTGRLLVGLLTAQQRIPQVILGLMGLAVVVYSVLFVFDLGDLVYILIYIAGFSLSALLPMMLSVAGLLYREMSGTVLGLVKIAIPLGSIVLPLVMGLVANHSSFQSSLFVFPAAFGVALLLIAAFQPRMQLAKRST
ncbi:MAG: MFS transporter [Anaerolineae bacterium]|nr:MFS transporter [Anaerolineae bacterium]